ncbi:hypothetical protein O6H91_22G070300 [Diphasiastrum complanatum]|uniref:Uncharacterized protein n=1 Tax=Diphasiastrum complanatum TaxID=34168 RepID=A0ACC2AGW0_DIPCM|nr:hypothetical protein O6H91_22G070300 [Diphasiastrum complanatum]
MSGGGEEALCVTGGTGYIASWLILRLLQSGYHVHTTVRDPGDLERVGFLWELPGAVERLKVFKADLLHEGSFDDAFRGVKGIFHTAGPVLFDPNDNPQVKMVEISLKGVLNVLKASAKSTTIKKVVLTSSCSAVRYDYNHTGQDLMSLDESNWSNPDYCTAHKLWYPLAKTLAERKAWEFAKQHGLNLVVVNASFIVGPLLQPNPTSTIWVVLSLLRGDAPIYPNTIIGFVHIDDVVKAHLLVYEAASASGRYICSERVSHWRDVLELLRKKYPAYPITSKESEEKGHDIPHIISTHKILRLGLPGFRTLEDMFDECIQSLEEKGFLKDLHCKKLE